VREVFISVGKCQCQRHAIYGSNNDGRHDIKVFKLAVMDGEGERSILISHESGYCCSPQ